MGHDHSSSTNTTDPKRNARCGPDDQLADIVVTGASGHTGREVTRQLAAGGHRFRILARSPAATTPAAPDGAPPTVYADYDDPDSLVAAFRGARAVYAVTPVDARSLGWMRNLIDAARRAKVDRFVKLSGLTAGPGSPASLMREHGDSDAHLRASGVPHTILQPNSFMQNVLMSLDVIKRQGTLYLAAGTARQSLIDLADVAAVAVTSLVRPARGNQTHALTGPESLSFDEVAAKVGRVMNKAVAYVPVSTRDAEQDMRAGGAPEWTARTVAEFLGAVATGAFAGVTRTVDEVLGRPASTFDQFLARDASLFQ